MGKEIYCCIYCGRDTRHRSKICWWCINGGSGGYGPSAGHDEERPQELDRVEEELKKEDE